MPRREIFDMDVYTLIACLIVSSVTGWGVWLSQYIYSRNLERIIDNYLRRTH
jgi:hypothetical protein